MRVPDSAADRRQWLQQQSKSRRQRRKSSGGVAARQDGGGGRRSSTGSRPTSAGYGSGSRDAAFSRASFPANDDGDSDTSSVASNLSIVSTPAISHGPRQETRRQRPLRGPGSPERPASVAGSPDRSSRRSSSQGRKGRDSSPPARPAVKGGRAARGSLARKSSPPSLSASVSSSLSLRWCGVCEAEFTRLRRPHRCRRCLEAVCAPCSPARLPVPGTASLELKRTCKLCAEESARLERRLDDAAAPTRRQAAAAAAAAATPAPAGAAGVLNRAHWRSASVGDLTRAPLEVISGVAAAVSAGLYPAPPPADGAEDGGSGKAGTSDGGEASLRARLAAGGLAALGAVGAGFGLSGENKPGEAGSEAGDNTGKDSTLRQLGGLFGSGKATAQVSRVAHQGGGRDLVF